MAFTIEVWTALPAAYREPYRALLSSAHLVDEGDADFNVVAFDASRLVACGSLCGCVLKQIAVDSAAEGEGACAAVVSALISEAASRGMTHLFLCTKPSHKTLFSSLGFYPLAETGYALLMENKRNGLDTFLHTLPVSEGRTGCVVCNCNPMTNGHLALIRFAARKVDHLRVFVVSEDVSLFPAEDRYALVCEATSDLPNVTVHRSSSYLVSRATFPTYFIPDTENKDSVRDDLDLELFRSRIAPALSITERFIGEEPYSAVTRAYNARMHVLLPERGIGVTEIPRYRGISASRVREMILTGRLEEIRDLVPPPVYAYCKSHTF